MTAGCGRKSFCPENWKLSVVESQIQIQIEWTASLLKESHFSLFNTSVFLGSFFFFLIIRTIQHVTSNAACSSKLDDKISSL